MIITDWGTPAFVLQRYEDWRRQSGAQSGLNLLEAIADPAGADIEFEPSRLEGPLAKPVSFD